MLKSPLEALVLLVHAIQFATSFRLNPAASGAQEGLLPDDFASKGSLEYKHEQSAMTFELKIVQIAKKAVIIAIAVEVSITTLLPYTSAESASWNVTLTWEHRMTRLAHSNSY